LAGRAPAGQVAQRDPNQAAGALVELVELVELAERRAGKPGLRKQAVRRL